MQAFNSSTFSCRTVSFLTNEILFTFLVANQKARKAIDIVRVILNKVYGTFTASFPSFITGI